jgi:Ca-activated chloride channel family protein
MNAGSLTFASPELLLALLLVPIALVAYLLLQRRRNRYVVRFTNVALLENLVPRRPSWRRHVPTALYLAAIAVLGIALARPSLVVPVPREEATVVLTMDTSRSMLATDVAPDRLTAAKAAASDFIASLPEGFRVALVAFSTEARLVMPPTTDRAQVQAALDALRADGGTALGDAIALSLEAADLGTGVVGAPAVAPSSPAPGTSGEPAPAPSASPDGTAEEPPLVATVLLSDGENSTGALEPLDAAADAVTRGVPVYTIALGTEDGIVEVPNGMGGTETLPVPPDTETLGQIADMTGGRFFEAPTSEDLAAIYESLGSRVGVTMQEQEVTQWFAAAGLLLVLGGAGLAAFWFNRIP